MTGEDTRNMGYNIIVGQSGGPTAVINTTLASVFQNAQRRSATNILGMRYGIRGLLEDNVVDLSDCIQNTLEFEILKRTPSSYLGSCRFRLADFEQDDIQYVKIFNLLNAHKIDGFLYIGGNDSMDTILKLSQYGQAIGSNICFIGIPKTIDNDLIATDHTPGYGSAAKYIAVTMREVIRDAMVYGTPSVTVVEIMGRNAGWLVAAAELAKDGSCEGVDMICLPEIPFDVDIFTQHVNKLLLRKKAPVVIAVSEGIKLANGQYVCERSDDARFVDAFGHKNLTGTARYLSNVLARKLSIKTRCIELSILQRCAGHLTSRTDVLESYQVGGAGVKAVMEGMSGQMVVLNRLSDDPYQAVTGLQNVETVANREKKVPLDWIDAEGYRMNNEFLRYTRPLVQAELPAFFIDGVVHHLKPLGSLSCS